MKGLCFRKARLNNNGLIVRRAVKVKVTPLLRRRIRFNLNVRK